MDVRLLDWLFSQGVPTVLLCGLCLFLVRVVLWLKKSVVEPITSSHLTLLATLRDQLPRHSDLLRQQTEILKKQDVSLMEQTRSLQNIETGIDRAIATTEAHRLWSADAVKTICKIQDGSSM